MGAGLLAMANDAQCQTCTFLNTCQITTSHKKAPPDDSGGAFAYRGKAGLHHAAHTTHAAHVWHAASWFVFLDLSDHRLSGDHQAGNRRSRLQSRTAFSQSTRWDTLDDDRENGCIRSVEHAYSPWRTACE